MSKISTVQARQILDSRGTPTIEVDVILDDGSLGRAAVPSGASTGSHESLELRDQQQTYYWGKSVEEAIFNAEEVLAPRIYKIDPRQQQSIDSAMVTFDGTLNLSRLGANAILAISLATSKAVAQSLGLPYYRYIHELYREIVPAAAKQLFLPTPMFNVMNGGAHTHWQSTDIQEFMLVPLTKNTFAEHVRWCSEVHHALRQLLADAGFETTTGDEGGFAPKLSSDEEAIEFLLKAIEKAGFQPGKDIGIAIDAAASEFWQDGKYHLKIHKKTVTAEEMISMWNDWVKKYPIVSIEDGLAEDDWHGWQKLHKQLSNKIWLVGDDLLITNVERIHTAQKKNVCNSLLMKVNQIGTLTEAMIAAAEAKKSNWQVIVSHRSGETEDTSIADIAVGIGAERIKAGAPAHGERTAKYNQLLRIEEELV